MIFKRWRNWYLVASGYIVATFMFKAPSYGFSFQYVSFCRSVNNIVFLSIEYVEFCANKTQFAGSFAFLLPFKEKCCWKSTNAVGSLWWLYSIDFNCEYCFDAIKKVILTRKTRPTEKVWRESGTLLDQDPNQTQEELAESLNVDQSISRHLKVIGMIQKQEN